MIKEKTMYLGYVGHYHHIVQLKVSRFLTFSGGVANIVTHFRKGMKLLSASCAPSPLCSDWICTWRVGALKEVCI